MYCSHASPSGLPKSRVCATCSPACTHALQHAPVAALSSSSSSSCCIRGVCRACGRHGTASLLLVAPRTPRDALLLLLLLLHAAAPAHAGGFIKRLLRMREMFGCAQHVSYWCCACAAATSRWQPSIRERM